MFTHILKLSKHTDWLILQSALWWCFLHTFSVELCAPADTNSALYLWGPRLERIFLVHSARPVWGRGGKWIIHNMNNAVVICILIIIYPLTTRVTGAPQMISQPVSSIIPCSPLPSVTKLTTGLSIIKAVICMALKNVFFKNSCGLSLQSLETGPPPPHTHTHTYTYTLQQPYNEVDLHTAQQIVKLYEVKHGTDKWYVQNRTISVIIELYMLYIY